MLYVLYLNCFFVLEILRFVGIKNMELLFLGFIVFVLFLFWFEGRILVGVFGLEFVGFGFGLCYFWWDVRFVG